MHWWQTAVIYQIYPRSFQDRNGDGVGDLPGIVARLPYLAELGVDAHLAVADLSLADGRFRLRHFRLHGDRSAVRHACAISTRCCAAAHARGLKVLLDFVPNHTSDRHPWFVESRASRASAKRDWYIWRDGAPGGGPPNNWLSEFGGSAWQFDEATGQYYYHAFLARAAGPQLAQSATCARPCTR